METKYEKDTFRFVFARSEPVCGSNRTTNFDVVNHVSYRPILVGCSKCRS
jgi:hypothetical protein